jgi:hypothetical protein
VAIPTIASAARANAGDPARMPSAAAAAAASSPRTSAAIAHA